MQRKSTSRMIGSGFEIIDFHAGDRPVQEAVLREQGCEACVDRGCVVNGRPHFPETIRGKFRTMVWYSPFSPQISIFAVLATFVMSSINALLMDRPTQSDGRRGSLIHEICACILRSTISWSSEILGSCHNGRIVSIATEALHCEIQFGSPATSSMSPVTTASTRNTDFMRARPSS